MNRRVAAMVIVAALVVGLVGLLGRDLVRDLISGGEPPAEQARPLSAAEAERLAHMRQHNRADGQAGVRAVIGDQGAALHAVGWVDWQRQLAYLALSSEQRPHQVTELVQAVPELIATRPMATDGGAAPAPPAAETASPTEPSAGPTGGPTPDGSPEPTATPTPATSGPHPPPPEEPPAAGWQLRHPGTQPVDTLLTLLFTIAADEPDAADLLARSEAQWLRRDHTGGRDVDVLLGPAIPPTEPVAPSPAATLPADPSESVAPTATGAPAPADTAGPAGTTDTAGPAGTTDTAGPAAPTWPAGTAAPTAPEPTGPAGVTPVPGPEDRSLAAMGGAVQYWLDEDARLHRLDALLAADIPVRVDLERSDPTVPEPLDLLGGPAADPRPVTEQEAAALTGLRQHSVATGGGAVTVTLPGTEGMIRATGWLDWQHTRAYLAVSGVDLGIGPEVGPQPEPSGPPDHSDSPGGDGRNGDGDGVPAEAGEALLIADQQGVSILPGEPATGDGTPPLPVPQRDGWHWGPWEARGDELGGFDLDLLLNEALALGGEVTTDPQRVREQAVWLRTGTVGGTPVTGYEIPRPAEGEVAAGEARMRYWVDGDGVLRRVEIRTRNGGFGQLDLTPGPVPELTFG